MLIDSFEVGNFRSLKHLKLEKLARVNLLVGKNNSGKTSVLEGLYLFTGTSVENWIDYIDYERHLQIENFSFLFYNFGTDERTFLRARIEPSQRNAYKAEPYDIEVLITAMPNQRLVNALALPGLLEEENLYRSPQAPTEPIRNIHISAHSSENHLAPSSSQSYSAQQRLLERDLRRGVINKSLSQPAFGQWIGTTMSMSELYARIEYLQVRKQDRHLNETLRRIDPRIVNIVLGGGGVIYIDLGPGFPDLSPINLLGDGVQRLLAIIAAMAHTTGAIVQIDEIDNGLHYTALRILWQAILYAAREYDVQVIATTHSAEALRHLTWVLDDEEYKDYRDDVAAYTLVRADDDTVRSYRHDYEQLDYALDHGLEVRN